MPYPKWDKSNAFETAADFLLGILERDLGIVCPNGNAKTKAAMINVLKFFTEPKDGPDGQSPVELRCREANRAVNN